MDCINSLGFSFEVNWKRQYENVFPNYCRKRAGHKSSGFSKLKLDYRIEI